MIHVQRVDPVRRDGHARAVAPLNVLCEYLLPFVRVGGYALCWKGPNVTEEMEDGIAAAEKLGGALEAPVALAWENENHLLSPIRKIETTLPQYPRKNWQRLPWASSSVTVKSGRAIASARPGNPAPVPTSMSRSPSGKYSAFVSGSSESRKWRRAISASGTLVKSMRVFQSISRS